MSFELTRHSSKRGDHASSSRSRPTGSPHRRSAASPGRGQTRGRRHAGRSSARRSSSRASSDVHAAPSGRVHGCAGRWLPGGACARNSSIQAGTHAGARRGGLGREASWRVCHDRGPEPARRRLRSSRCPRRTRRQVESVSKGATSPSEGYWAVPASRSHRLHCRTTAGGAGRVSRL